MCRETAVKLSSSEVSTKCVDMLWQLPLRCFAMKAPAARGSMMGRV